MAMLLLAYLTFQGIISSLLVMYGLPATTFALSLQSIDASLQAAPRPFQESPTAYHTNRRKNHNSNCQKISIPICRHYYNDTTLPNDYGHHIQPEVETVLSNFFPDGKNNYLKINYKSSNVAAAFLCLLYLPPCFHDNRYKHPSRIPVVPCQSLCEAALLSYKQDYIGNKRTEFTPYFQMTSELSGRSDSVKRTGTGSDIPPWPMSCDSLPRDNCYTVDEHTGVVYNGPSTTQTPTRRRPDDIPRFASLDVELGSDDGYELEVISASANHVPGRRYDVTDLGDPEMFRGWADVQGAGAANDYCRVVGKPKRRFLSCNLAGGQGQGHHYVSKLNFDPGWPHTWFMRDMDGDGRDDYCRCTGSARSSHVTCMKAGPRGFHGSLTQGGSQHSFTLINSAGCHKRGVNPWFGE